MSIHDDYVLDNKIRTSQFPNKIRKREWNKGGTIVFLESAFGNFENNREFFNHFEII